MLGTIINAAAIIAGGALGLWFGARLPDRLRQTAFAGLGLFTLVIGVQMTFKTKEPLIILGGLMVGGFLGEWWRIEDHLHHLGVWLEKRLSTILSREPQVQTPGEIDAEHRHLDSSASMGKHSSRFIRGFTTASLLFCIGPIAILGSIQDGLTGDSSLLVIKSVMDGFASLAFASAFGPGVLFSSLMVFIYQGSISLLASNVQAVFTPSMMDELTSVGGILLMGVAISSILEIKPIRVGNFLPALVITPLIVAILAALGINR
jgi:uncharacterized membrane protein YqgA involved in biofilm formation